VGLGSAVKEVCSEPGQVPQKRQVGKWMGSILGARLEDAGLGGFRWVELMPPRWLKKRLCRRPKGSLQGMGSVSRGVRNRRLSEAGKTLDRWSKRAGKTTQEKGGEERTSQVGEENWEKPTEQKSKDVEKL